MAWDSYKLLDDPAIRAMLPKVNCVHDDEIEAEFPANMSGRITIRARGRAFSRKVIIPLGEPANFLSEDALLAKFEGLVKPVRRSEEHTSELQSLMRISYAVFCLKKKKKANNNAELQ